MTARIPGPSARPKYEKLIVDEAAIREMVEDFWRAFIATARTDQAASARSVHSFEERIAKMAETMPERQRPIFLHTIDDERERLFQEYQRDPEALKRRLGLPGDQMGQGVNVKVVIRDTASPWPMVALLVVVAVAGLAFFH
jgi:hypothetical protein